MPARSYMPTNRKDSTGRKFLRAVEQRSIRTEDRFLRNPAPSSAELAGHGRVWPQVDAQHTGAKQPTRSRSIRQHKRIADYG